MATSVRKTAYFSMRTPNRAGQGARLLSALAAHGVNLLAFTAFPSARKSQVDFVPADPAAFLVAAKRAKVKLSKPKTVFLIEGDDRVGALADIMAKLGAAKINVTAVDAVCAGGGRYGAMLWVKPRDVKRAAAALGAL